MLELNGGLLAAPTASATPPPASATWPGEQVLRQPGRHHDHPAADPDPGPAHRGQRRRPRVRHHATVAPPVGRGWEYLTGHRLGLRRRGRRAARAAGRAGRGAVGRGRPLRPGDRPLQPVADHPRVDRPRHRAGPGARLRGGVRGHLVRHLRPAGHAAVRQRGDERDRRPAGRARPGHHRLRRRGGRRAAVRHRLRRHPGRLPAGPADGGREGARPLQRLRVRRLPRPHPDAADAQRLAAAGARRAEHRGADLRRGARHLHRGRQVVVDRHAALQLPVHRPAVLPDRERPAGRAAQGRGLPGDHHRLLAVDGGRRRPGDLPARRGVQLRQGAARSGGAGLPRQPDGAVPRGQHAEHPGRRRQPHEHGRAASWSSGRWTWPPCPTVRDAWPSAPRPTCAGRATR